jgi:polyisoprenoid-binding protein YceI
MFRKVGGFAAAGLAVMLLGAPSGARAQQADGATRWVVDIVHSQIDFRVRHLLGRVRGTFTNWYALIETDGPDWTHGRVKVSIQTRSLDTGNRYRDADLRSNRFFAVDSFPKMIFESSGIHVSDTTVVIDGILTIKGRSHPVQLTGQYRGIARDAEGHQRIAFDATTTVDRRDYGIDWNQLVGGNTLIGNEVEITIALEAARVN